MKRKFLSIFLTLAMALTLLPTAAMAEGETAVAKVGDVEYATLQKAINAATAGQTVKLVANTAEDIKIPANKDITLDLGGKTLSNTNNSKATLSVEGTAVVKNGTISGGTSYYNIEVKKGGSLTLENVTATAGNTGSSMIDNWGTLTIESGDYSGGLDVVKSEPGATLLITGGTFALNYAVAWSYTGVVLSYGDLTITGGTFNQNAATPAKAYPTVVVTAKDKVDDPTPHTKITGGVFNNAHSSSSAKIFHPMHNATSDNFEVSGGTFNKSVPDAYFADGYFAQKGDGVYTAAGPYKAKIGSTAGYATLPEAIAAAKAGDTVTLLVDTSVTEPIVVDKAITLDLGYKTLTSTWVMPSDASGAGRYALVDNAKMTMRHGTFAVGQARGIGAYAGLTLSGITVTQELTGGHACVAFCKDGATYAIKSSTKISGDYAVANFANNANITINNATLEGKTCGLYHNGSNYGLKLKVTGTTINGSLDGTIGSENDPSGVYISGSASHGTMQNATFTNCTIKGATAIEVKYTDLTLDKCTVEATVKTPSYDKNSNGMTALGFAVVSTDNSKAGETPVPTGTVTIKGKGNYKGLVGLGALESVKTNYEGFKDETIKVSGGTFSSEVKPEYCAPGFVPKANDDGTYGVEEYLPVEVWTGYTGAKVASYKTIAEAAANLGENKWIVIGKDYTLNEDFAIPKGVFLDVAKDATLTVAEGVTLTVAANAKRLGVRDDAKVVNNGTILVCGTTQTNGVVSKVGLKYNGKIDVTGLTVGNGMILVSNSAGAIYYAAEAAFEITYGDGSTKKIGTQLSGLEGAVKLTMLKNVNDFAGTIGSTDKVADNFVLDLGGYTLTGKATATSPVLSISVPMTIQNGTVKFAGPATENAGALRTSADVTIASDVAIDGGVGYAIWTDGYGHTLTVNGTVGSNGSYAITSNGAENGGLIADCNITVNAGAVISAPNGVAIYHPEKGTVTINGGEIKGHTGIEMCAGKLVVKDGTITSTGANKDETGSQNAILDGAAISIINRNYPGGVPTAEITGGTIKATGTGMTVKAYDYKNDTVVSWTDVSNYVDISSGTFSSIPDNMNALCAAGYIPFKNADGTYGVTRPSSGSSGSYDPTYSVTTPSKSENGGVAVSSKNARKGDTVTVTVTPDAGYQLDKLTVTDKDGNELKLTDKGDGKYSFTMPDGKVEVKTVFAKKVETSPFGDVSADAYYYKAVQWAQEKGITDGISSNLFGPKQPCTRSQIVTFLWRAAGSPEPKSTAAGMTDVVPGSYYAKAVAWAVENGITTGTAEGTFSPDATCTRAQAVTFLARAQNAKATGKTAFSDVPADSYFADAVAWAQANGVTTGTSETTFSPDSDCTRAQIVTFLYRANQGT